MSIVLTYCSTATSEPVVARFNERPSSADLAAFLTRLTERLGLTIIPEPAQSTGDPRKPQPYEKLTSRHR